MLFKTIKKVILLAILAFVFHNKAFAFEIISADNPNFQYTGRIDFTIPNKPVIYWPGSYIKTNFEGSLLIINLDDETGESFYNVFIDDDYENPYIIDCRAGNQIYLISTTLADTVHSLEIFRRTESDSGPTKFLGVYLDDGKTLLPPQTRPNRKIIFYGDSITCGLGNEAPDNVDLGDMSQENNFLAYGAIASRTLEADYMCIAKSGIGLMISWFPVTMPEYYYRLDPEDANSFWNFNEFVPDVVVINIFQNDSWLINNLNPIPDSSQRVEAYATFLRTIRSKHPNAFIIGSLGSMDATREGSPWPGYISSAVEKLRIEDADSNLGTFFFPFDPNWRSHPRVRHHLEMGANLANYIKDEMGWNTNIEDNFIDKLPTSFHLSQNYPNPFNPSTEISFSIPHSGNIKLSVYNAIGQQVAELVNQPLAAGSHEVVFNASHLSSGIYFYRLQSGDFVATKKMVLMK